MARVRAWFAGESRGGLIRLAAALVVLAVWIVLRVAVGTSAAAAWGAVAVALLVVLIVAGSRGRKR
jgi:hypothetical protein